MTSDIQKTNEFLIRSSETEQLRLSYSYGYRIPRSTHTDLTVGDIKNIVAELSSIVSFMEEQRIPYTSTLLSLLRDKYIYEEISKTTVEWHYQSYTHENFKTLSKDQPGVYLLQVTAKRDLDFKVGCTQSLRDRIKQHYNLMRRNPVFLYAFIPTPNYKELEAAILYKLAGTTRLEWFDRNDELVEFAQYLYSVRGNNE
jgi:hypothetical protein